MLRQGSWCDRFGLLLGGSPALLAIHVVTRRRPGKKLLTALCVRNPPSTAVASRSGSFWREAGVKLMRVERSVMECSGFASGQTEFLFTFDASQSNPPLPARVRDNCTRLRQIENDFVTWE
jgi:hypothetical protein